MKKEKAPPPPRSLITELAFKLILDSEETEGYQFNIYTVESDGTRKMVNIDKQVVLEFLENEYTKVSVKSNPKTGFLHLIASNTLSNETIKIAGLADHYLALLQVVDRATKTKKMLAKDKNTPLLSHEFIQEVNLSLQAKKFGEIGIGQYRLYDYLGNPVEMCVTSTIDGVRKPVRSVKFTQATQVQSDMDDLVDWVNNVAFKKGRYIMKDITEFHARMIKIHPFTDGNGRTARLLTNYILLSLGKPIISIPIDKKTEYIHSLNYANTTSVLASSKDINGFTNFLVKKFKEIFPADSTTSPEEIVEVMDSYRTKENKYDFLYDCLKEHQIHLSSKSVIANILNDYGQKTIDFRFQVGSISADQIEFENI